MENYRFHLEKYRLGSKKHCPKCGHKACFVRYVDDHNQVAFPDYVGRCDHEHSCGYHYTPKDYFCDNPNVAEELNKDAKPFIVPKPSTLKISSPLLYQTIHHGTDAVPL